MDIGLKAGETYVINGVTYIISQGQGDYSENLLISRSDKGGWIASLSPGHTLPYIPQWASAADVGAVQLIIADPGQKVQSACPMCHRPFEAGQ